MKNELLILIPTYNEIENVEEILSQILGLELPADILFIDDNYGLDSHTHNKKRT